MATLTWVKVAFESENKANSPLKIAFFPDFSILWLRPVTSTAFSLECQPLWLSLRSLCRGRPLRPCFSPFPTAILLLVSILF